MGGGGRGRGAVTVSRRGEEAANLAGKMNILNEKLYFLRRTSFKLLI
jgi:hypothetical protein